MQLPSETWSREWKHQPLSIISSVKTLNMSLSNQIFFLIFTSSCSNMAAWSASITPQLSHVVTLLYRCTDGTTGSHVLSPLTKNGIFPAYVISKCMHVDLNSVQTIHNVKCYISLVRIVHKFKGTFFRACIKNQGITLL